MFELLLQFPKTNLGSPSPPQQLALAYQEVAISFSTYVHTSSCNSLRRKRGEREGKIQNLTIIFAAPVGLSNSLKMGTRRCLAGLELLSQHELI